MEVLVISSILLFVSILYLHRDTAINQDLGRHLLLGKIISSTFTVPHTNLFSYTYPDYPFINHHWGSEVILYMVDSVTGINGLIIMNVIVMVISVASLIFFSLNRVSVPSIYLSTFLALSILRERTAIRPEIFAYFLFSLFLILLYKEKEKTSRFGISILPLLMLLWVNSHISFIIGLTLYALFCIDRILYRQWRNKYLYTGCSLLAMTLVNPYGLSGALFPLRIFNNYGYAIVENQSPLFLQTIMPSITIPYFECTVVIILVVSILLLIRKYYFETFTIILSGILSFSAIRHFPFFALSIIYPLALGITLMVRESSNLFPKKMVYSNISIIPTALIFILFSFQTISLLKNDSYRRFSGEISGVGQVKGLRDTLDYFISNKMKGPIFNNFDDGSYLIYRLYPDERVFVDGRPEAYPAEFFHSTYIPMQLSDDIWQATVKQYGINTIIWAHTDNTPWGSQFLKRITRDPGWKLVYFDDYGLIMQKNETVSPDKYPAAKWQKYGESLIRISKEPDSLARLINLFQILGYEKLQQSAIEKYEKLQ